MDRRQFTVGLVATLAAGSQAIAASIPAPKSGMGLILFYRPRRALAAAIRFQVNTSSAAVGNLSNGSVIAFHAPPGAYTFSVSTPSVAGGDTISVDLQAGQTAFIRADMRAGWPAGRGKFIRMPDEQARSEISKI
ncbi:MAG: DUF2846 domain-containing protein [Shimia sp.]|uniref:DUF2846 domain-containing protein n=1 Tax=Shimia sp. TaxID=1954381 RepID=UPI0040595383